ncbi:MAG: cysteine hydrolase [Roseibium sp.]|uniref:cysteine hydrolase family protein n=1 Tax=Roseibium sp. TaxID=1936156 RepID=UPI002617F440|nr:cysteine hydrolase family protein [Roseibium sp.]MCV0428958.1 cysteine hydrolase [Roseibium sp.]
MDVLLIVDMQCGLMEGAAKHNLSSVIEHINALTKEVRRRNGAVIWIRHCGTAGESFEPGTSSWAFLPELIRNEDDTIVEKSLNDGFAGTELKRTLEELQPTRVMICGWATDFCVDSTVRSAVSNRFPVAVVSDAHTLADRPHLSASAVKEHHHWLWQNLISETPVQLIETKAYLEEPSR